MPALLQHAGSDLGRELNRDHPTSRDCVVATHFAERSTGVISGSEMPSQDSFNAGRIRGTVDPPQIVVGDGGLQFATGRGGRALECTVLGASTGSRVGYGAADRFLPTEGSFTALCYYEKTDTTDRVSGLFGVSGSTGSTHCGVFGPFSDGIVYFDHGGTSSGTTRLTWSGAPFAVNEPNVFVFYVGERGMEIWMDGLLRASHSNRPTRTSSTNEFRIGRHISGEMDLVRWYTFQCWDRGLTEAEIGERSRDPFGLFRQPVQRTYFVPATGVSHEYLAAHQQRLSNYRRVRM